MKKIAFMLVALAMSVAAHAQFEEGKVYVGTSLTGLDMHYNGDDKFNFGIDAKAGYFYKDDIMITAKLGYFHKGNPNANGITIGAGARYYFEQNGIFLGGGLNYDGGPNGYSDLKPTIEAGYAFFINHYVTVEPGIYYEQSFLNHSRHSEIGLRLGIGLYTDKKKLTDAFTF